MLSGSHLIFRVTRVADETKKPVSSSRVYPNQTRATNRLRAWKVVLASRVIKFISRLAVDRGPRTTERTRPGEPLSAGV